MSSRSLTGSSGERAAARHAQRPQPDRELLRAGPATERRLVARAQRTRRRQQNLVVGLLAATWLPGLLGAAAGASFLRSWGALGGYTGLSWAIPALVVGVMVNRAMRERGLPGHRLLGVGSAGATAGVLLYSAAAIIGP